MSLAGVDLRLRTITGLVLPWNTAGIVTGKLCKFAPEALWPQPPNRLLDDHDNSALLGRLIADWSTPEGQWATYRLRRGAVQDRALACAASGAKTGMSVGLDPESLRFATDPADPDVPVIVEAGWLESSLTSNPRFLLAGVLR